MSEPSPNLRIVGEGERPRRPRRGPGPAVLLVGLYAIAFGVALWLLRGQALRPRAATPGADHPPRLAAAGPAKTMDRRNLLSGAGLEPEARAEYLEHLATDCCDCGCGMTLAECLAGEQKCVRSAQEAEERWKRLR